MATFEEILSNIEGIRTEVLPEANTAHRVGGAMKDTLLLVEDNRKSLSADIKKLSSEMSEKIESVEKSVETLESKLTDERKERTEQDGLLWGGLKNEADNRAAEDAKINKRIEEVETHTINGKALSENPELKAKDVGAVPVVDGKIPESYMPSWVDDMVDFHGIDDNFSGSFAPSGNTLEQPTAVIYITGTFYAIGTDGLAYDNWKSYGDIKASEFYGTLDGSNGVIPVSGKVYLDTTTNKTYRWSGTQLAPIGDNLALGETAATAYPGNKGKEVYDAVFAEQKSVPTPAIKISWTFQNNAGSTVEGVNESTDSTNPILERGYKATYSASYSWTNSNSAKYKNPIAASGSWTTLTLDGADSEMISDTIIATSSNKSVNVTLSAPKTGLMVSGNKVIPATGNDTASASKSVTFLPRIYYGWSDAIPTGDTAADTIKKLLNKLQNEATFNSPASKPDGTQYYVFAYPKEWGTINKILMDNADPVTTTFSNNNEVKIANAAGVEHTYYVSVTVAPQKEESFNANVSFSFYFN